jgi:hypothetical protein
MQYFKFIPLLLIWTSSIFCSEELSSKKSSENFSSSLATAIAEKEYQNIWKLLFKERYTPLQKLAPLVQQSNDAHLSKALLAAQEVSDTRFGLSHSKLFALALYFETEGAALQENGSDIVKAKGIPWDLEYSDKSQNWYVHLDREIARGHNKILKKAIMYRQGHFEPIACATQAESMKGEKEFYVRYAHRTGFMRVYDVVKSAGETRVFCKLYNQGSLKSVIQSNLHFTLQEKEEMARQILTALATLQHDGFIHRDLKADNLLVNITIREDRTRNIEVVLTDFGHGLPAKKCVGIDAQWNPKYNCPDSIMFKDMQPSDYFKTDLFAAGYCMYQIFYGHGGKWVDKELVTNEMMPAKIRAQMFSKRLKYYTNDRRNELWKKYMNKTITEEEEFEYLILTTIHADPNKRMHARSLLSWLNEIINRQVL